MGEKVMNWKDQVQALKFGQWVHIHPDFAIIEVYYYPKNPQGPSYGEFTESV